MGKFKKKIYSSSKDEEIEELSTVQKAADDDDQLEDDEEPAVPKWYEEYPLVSLVDTTLPPEQVTSLMIEAQTVLDAETKFNVSKSRGANKSSWIKTVMTKGTTKDKVAAGVITIQNSPVHSLPVLTSLVGSVKVAKKKECMLIMDTLCDLFVEDLLRAGVKLRALSKQPLARLEELTSGCVRSRRRLLAAWLFEDKLKELYGSYVEAVNLIAKDTVDANRIKAVATLNKLLMSHPEQEQVLLQHIINKLGDPSAKVVSKVIYGLTQLLRVHSNMKQTVMNEVEKLLFRPHISQRAQYYSVCFLSQFVFTDKDRPLAKSVIDIYFSFFKALIKQGEVDSRMLAALLMGVKRAFPFARLEEGSLSSHVDTLYKLVHLSRFNIAVHALCLLQEVSKANEDRFYSALYRKLLDPTIGKSCHHAMLINLLYKSLSKDSNAERVKAIVKRLFQLCFYLPVPVVCSLLNMISLLLDKRSKMLFANELTAQTDGRFTASDEGDDDDGEEVYFDVGESKEEQVDDGAVKVEEGDDEETKKPLRGWVHYALHKNSWQKSSESANYDPFHRNPAFSKAEKTAYLEMLELTKHFHPSVSTFINRIMNKDVIAYTGDPLADFTLSRFLERFVFKNPKQLSDERSKGPHPLLASRKYYQPAGVRSMNVTSANYLDCNESDIPVDELFLFRYLKEKREQKKAAGIDDDEDDKDSVASEEFEEMLDRMVGWKKSEVDYMDEIGNSLKKAATVNKDKKQSVQDESEDSDEDISMSDIDVDDDEDDAEVMDFDDEEGGFESDIDLKDAFNDDKGSRSRKRKLAATGSDSTKSRRTDGFEGLFAPAEEFAEILEEAGSSRQKPGTHTAVSNKDNSAQKQLDWEKKRDMWVRDRGTFNKRKNHKHSVQKSKKR